MCCTCFAHDCAWTTSVYVLETCSEETVKILNCAFDCDYFYYYCYFIVVVVVLLLCCCCCYYYYYYYYYIIRTCESAHHVWSDVQYATCSWFCPDVHEHLFPSFTLSPYFSDTWRTRPLCQLLHVCSVMQALGLGVKQWIIMSGNRRMKNQNVVKGTDDKEKRSCMAG